MDRALDPPIVGLANCRTAVDMLRPDERPVQPSNLFSQANAPSFSDQLAASAKPAWSSHRRRLLILVIAALTVRQLA